MPPHSGGMCGSQMPQSSRAMRRSLTMALITSPRWPWSIASHSGRTTSSMSARTLRRISSTSGGNEKSIMAAVWHPTPEPGRLPPVTTEPGPTSAAWDRDSLPAGRGEGGGGPPDVRRHRSPLRPGQPGDDVPPRRPVATPGRAARLALPPGAAVRDLASGTGDLCVELARQRPAPAVGRPLVRDARRRPQRRAPGAGRHPAPPVPARRARRGDVRLRAAQPGRPGAVLRRARPGGAARRAHRPARRRHAAQPGAARGATTSTSARSCPQIGGLLSDPAAYRYLPKSVAYLPAAGRDAGAAAARPASPTSQRRLLSGGITQLVTADAAA